MRVGGMVMSHRRRPTLLLVSICLVLGSVMIAVLGDGPSEASTGTEIEVVDDALEFELLESEGAVSLGQDCDPCTMGLGECDPEGQVQRCGSGGSCCCKYCGGNWGCWSGIGLCGA